MNVDLNRELFADVAIELGLPHPGLVEKDFHVVRALKALQKVHAEGAYLVFGGGTSLCRAHLLIERMSEDIDLRIVTADPGAVLGEGARKRFRQAVSQALLEAGFLFDPQDPQHLKVHDAGKTFVYNLPYTPVTDSVTSLRSGVKVEISSWPLHLPPVQKDVSSFIAIAKNEEPEIKGIPCVDVAETAADKFVALTRRIAEEQLDGVERDASLIRHIYDLNRITPSIVMSVMPSMLGAIIESDRKSRGTKVPGYAEDPVAVSLRSIELLSVDDGYAAVFAKFQQDMVYGDHVEMSACLPTLRQYADQMGAVTAMGDAEPPTALARSPA